jgi:hypothetical protein
MIHDHEIPSDAELEEIDRKSRTVLPRLIESQEQHRASEREVARLEARQRDGLATEEEVERMRKGQELLLIYDWGQQGRQEAARRRQQPGPSRRVHSHKRGRDGKQEGGEVEGAGAALVGRRRRSAGGGLGEGEALPAASPEPGVGVIARL